MTLICATVEGADSRPAHLATATRTLPLGQLHDAFATLLGGQARGRFVVDLSGA
jgi:D-arabinose 1-dehydrogenase-like Zn-dependent alcohol dehydrogenase